jgi:Ran GTPase-activating protein (RanGAP) involved in mRNA processing and transport
MIRSLRAASCSSSQTSEYTISRMEDERLRKTIERLRLNDPELVELDFRNIGGFRAYHLEGGNELFQELLNGIRINTTIRKVNIVLRFLDTLSDEEKIQLFSAVGSLRMLESLRVGSSGLAGIAMKLVSEAISRATNLKVLKLHSIHFRKTVRYKSSKPTNVNDEEFIEFCQALGSLHHLTSFTLDDVEETFDLNPVLEIVANLPALESLSFKSYDFSREARLSTESLALLSSSSTLKTLSLKRLHLTTLLPKFILDLESNDALQILDLDSNQMGRECGAAIAYLIRFNDTIRELHLGCNCLTDESGTVIASALANNTTLEVLSLQANYLMAATATAIGNLLGSDACYLESLDVSRNAIEDDGGASLAIGLRTNTRLKSLMISETRITRSTFDFLASSLALNLSLERLVIAGNKVDDRGILGLADALKVNDTLKSLNLYGNHIGNVGAVALARALQVNSTLEQLNLASNHVLTMTSCIALEEMMNKNMRLKHLWLPNTIPDSTIPNYINLNRVGRRTLLQEMDNAPLWCEAIVQIKDDLFGIFYLIRSNPAVVTYANMRPPSMVP